MSRELKGVVNFKVSGLIFGGGSTEKPHRRAHGGYNKGSDAGGGEGPVQSWQCAGTSREGGGEGGPGTRRPGRRSWRRPKGDRMGTCVEPLVNHGKIL